MQALTEANREFEKRTQLLLSFVNVSIKGLTDLVVSYAVSRYELFQEAMLRRHWVDSFLVMKNSPCSCRRGLLDELLELASTSILVAEFLSEVNYIEQPTPLRKLQHSLELMRCSGVCHRIACFYSDNRQCKCQRTILARDVISGLPLDSF